MALTINDIFRYRSLFFQQMDVIDLWVDGRLKYNRVLGSFSRP